MLTTRLLMLSSSAGLTVRGVWFQTCWLTLVRGRCCPSVQTRQCWKPSASCVCTTFIACRSSTLSLATCSACWLTSDSSTSSTTLWVHRFARSPILLFIQKYVHHRSKLPAVFSTYFEENKLLHCHILGKKNDLHRYAVQSEIGKKIVKYRAS